MSVVACPVCKGRGSRPENQCGLCLGTGAIEANEKFSVDIPAGVGTGSQLRLDGLGEQGQNAPGDLFVFVNVREHKIFQREGNDIHIETPISFSQAALGAEIGVPTLFGKTKLRIPAGIQTGTVLRMRGEGMPYVRGKGKGDQFVHVVVRTPTGLSDKQKKLLSEFDDTPKKGFFEGMFH